MYGKIIVKIFATSRLRDWVPLILNYNDIHLYISSLCCQMSIFLANLLKTLIKMLNSWIYKHEINYLYKNTSTPCFGSCKYELMAWGLELWIWQVKCASCIPVLLYPSLFQLAWVCLPTDRCHSFSLLITWWKDILVLILNTFFKAVPQLN